MAKEITILHVFKDEKFFDFVSNFFDSLEGVTNIYNYLDTNNASFEYIKYKEKVNRITSEREYYKSFSDQNIDIIYLHSLFNTKIFDYIDSKKKIILWSWGYDLYTSQNNCAPIIKAPLLKARTKKFTKLHKKKYSLRIKVSLFIKYPYRLFIRFLNQRKLNKILERIDFHTPVLPIEYEYIKMNRHFLAKPFLPGLGPGIIKETFLYMPHKLGNIQIGNSFNPSNNHIDIFDILKDLEIGNRKYIVPINYSKEYNCSNDEFKQEFKITPNNVIWLEDFMPLEEYNQLNKTITHAIYGHLRQQALGNVYMGFRHGIKMYFFKDSMNYKQLKDWGFIVFTIEDDLNSESLNALLSSTEAEHNFNLYMDLFRNRKERYEKALMELIHDKNQL